MSVTKIASRYAKSLMDLAIESNNLENVLEDINEFKKATDNRDFYMLLKSPIVNKEKKISIFQELFEGKANELTYAFLNILVRKGRENYLPEIANQFISQYKALKSISSVTLTTAVPIPEGQLSKIREKLNESESTRDNIDIETEIDEDIIGGFILEIEDKMYDASIAHKLDQLKKEYSSNKYVKSF